jgi:hypothetical protein
MSEIEQWISLTVVGIVDNAFALSLSHEDLQVMPLLTAL